MPTAYDHIAEQWHSKGREQSYVQRVLGYVDLVLQNVKPGARVIDLGCGTGNPISKHISQKGFHVVGIDESQKVLAIAKKEVPDAEFIHDGEESLDEDRNGRRTTEIKNEEDAAIVVDVVYLACRVQQQ